MTQKTFSPGDVLFFPNESSAAARTELEYRRANRENGLDIGISEIDAVLNPILADNLVSILGRPGSGKTGFMMRWARHLAVGLARRGIENQVILYITYEQSVEDLTAFNVAANHRVSIAKLARGNTTDAEFDKVVKALTENIGMPMAIIGHSKMRRRARPTLTLTNVFSTIEYMIDQVGIMPRAIFLDYLQRIPGEGNHRGDRRLEVSESVDRLKDAALTYGAPFIVGVQARREVDNRELPVPLLGDGQETANIEQASDCVLSLVRPSKYRKEGESFGRNVIVKGYTQMLVTLLKQKLGRDNAPFWIEFDPEYNELIKGE